MFFVPEIIDKKKRGEKLSKEEMDFIIKGYVKQEIPDYQISALLMAIYFKGMDEEETTNLTLAMVNSGDTVDLSGIDGIKVDKHSTGGIADTTTLVLLPLVASAGVKLPKMSGRGLGHTGGTIDKLESIPGFNVELTGEQFIKNTNEIGASITGQSSKLVPADKKLYSLRDVTGTVDSIPLIASSIMSKKIAGGADKIILDVKFGNGAFMENYEKALELGKLMVKIGELAGRETIAYITDMQQPLGIAIGNAIEIIEAVETLKGRGHKNLTELCAKLGAEMMYLVKVKENRKRAEEILRHNIQSGKALLKFKEIIESQGGDPSFIEDYSLLPQAKYSKEIKADESGYVSSIDAKNLGTISMKLGAGRQKKDDVIDKSVGMWVFVKVGDGVKKGKTFAKVLANDKEKLDWAAKQIKNSIEFSKEYVEKRKVIWAKITKNSIIEY